ncbi:MAG TPA: OmpA family protein [Azospirillaceae bacterium]|nr:OmpA family protein [Azospirillaceae bacterium]
MRARHLILPLSLLLAPAAHAQVGPSPAPERPVLPTPAAPAPPPPVKIAPLPAPAKPQGTAIAPVARPADPPGATAAPRTELGPAAPATAPAAVPAAPKLASLSLPFAAGTAAPSPESEAGLRDIAEALGADPRRRLEIRAYAAQGAAGESDARRLSLSRALAVRDRLVALGVPQPRLMVFALGSKVPEGGAGADRVDLALVD